ncbi:MAG: hypothetical protein ACXWWQ_08210, partial [Candidatus Limnocylindria bacterium]
QLGRGREIGITRTRPGIPRLAADGRAAADDGPGIAVMPDVASPGRRRAQDGRLKMLRGSVSGLGAGAGSTLGAGSGTVAADDGAGAPPSAAWRATDSS